MTEKLVWRFDGGQEYYGYRMSELLFEITDNESTSEGSKGMRFTITKVPPGSSYKNRLHGFATLDQAKAAAEADLEKLRQDR